MSRPKVRRFTHWYGKNARDNPVIIPMINPAVAVPNMFPTPPTITTRKRYISHRLWEVGLE